MAMKANSGQMTFDDYTLRQVDVRLVLKEGAPLYSTQAMSGPRAAVEVMREAMKDLDREMVCVVNMDQKLRPINYHVVSIGDINESLVPVQNVYKSGILSNAANIMLLHNHPSGDAMPSGVDRIMTKRLIEAGKLMNIPVMDHVIIGGGEGKLYSFREHDSDMFMDQMDMTYIKQLTAGVREGTPEYRGVTTMMNRKEFFEYIKDNVRDYLPPSYDSATIDIQQVTKNNDMQLHAIIIKKENEQLVPSIYMDPLYRAYRSGKSLDSCVSSIADMRIEHENPYIGVDIKDLLNYEAMKEKLQIRLCDPETNQNRLKDAVYTMHGDFAAYYTIVVGQTEDGVGSVTVNEKIRDMWGITPEQLHADALAADLKREPVLISTDEMIEQMMFGRGSSENLLYSDKTVEDFYQPLFCLSNAEKLNGASMIVQDDVMKQIGDIMGGNYYVLPSSIHETLILPDNGAMGLPELSAMVHEVNTTQVEPQDRLSDKVQYYDRDAGVLENAEKREKRLAAEKGQEKKGIHSKLAEAKKEIKSAALAKDNVKSNVKTADVSL